MTALQVGTVYACVNIISNGVAGLPLNVYERLKTDNRTGKQVATDHSLYDLFRNEPNAEMTRFTFFKTMLCHDLLWGNAYSEIERDKSNNIIALWPRNPARTRPIRNVQPIMLQGTMYPAGTLMYETTEPLQQMDYPSAEQHDLNMGRRRIVLAEDMIHVPGLSLDGRLGQSTVYLARQIIGLSLATEKYGAKFFGNGARPAGILTFPNKMQEIQIENVRRSWQEAHGGENAFKVAVLDQGIKFEKIASTPEEGQMLQTRTYERGETCAVFNVPLHMVGAAEKSGKSNIEQSSIEFVLYCLNPWLVSWEEELTRKCFPKMGRTANKFFPKFDVRRLMYPDSAARSAFYTSGRQWGYLSGNDIRELEDMNPLPGDVGDKIWMPTNMQDAGDPIAMGAQATVNFHQENPEYSPQQEHKNKLALAKASAPAVAPASGGAAAAPAASGGAKPGSPAAKPGAKPGVTNKGKGRRYIRLGAGMNDTPAYVMRHGTTDANLQDLYRGWGKYSLDEEGRKAALQAAMSLKDKGIKRIVTSSLPRHWETAQICSDGLGVPIEIDDGFKTLNVGLYTGQKKAEVGDEVQWYLDNPEEVIPGGESLDDFRARSAGAFARMRADNSMEGPTLVITSRSNIAALENAGVTGGNVKVAEPGGIYRLDATNNLTLIYGDQVSDSLAGT